MNLVLLLSLGLGLLLVTGCTLWFLARTKSATADLGSISRNWITEHRNESRVTAGLEPPCSSVV